MKFGELPWVSGREYAPSTVRTQVQWACVTHIKFDLIACFGLFSENELPEGPPSINTSPRPTKGPSGIAYECSLKDGVKIALETIITDPFNSMDNSHSILELARSMDDSFCERYCSQIEDAMTDIVGSVGFGVSFQLDRELMFSKFHTLRCTSEFVDSVVDLVSQYANSNTISVAPVFVQILLEETLDAFLNTFITSKVSEVREVPVSDNDQAVLFYIAGFIVHSTLKRYGESMSGLQQRLTARATDTEPTFLSKHRFWIEKCDRGGLKQPSDSFFLLIRQCENVLRDYIDIDKLDKNTLMQEATQERLLDDFMVKHHWDQCAQGVCVESSMKLLDHITRLFLRVRGAAIQRYKQRQLQKRVKKSGKRKSSLRGGLGEKHWN